MKRPAIQLVVLPLGALFGLLGPPAQAAVLQAGDAAGLIGAIDLANGTPGVDVIELTASVTLETVHHDDGVTGPVGLPTVLTPIVVLGHGFAVERAATAPPFRLLEVRGAFFGEGDLTLDRVVLRGGQAAGEDDCFLHLQNCGGALLSYFGEVTMRNGTVLEGNGAFAGGGVFNVGGHAALRDVLLRDNFAAQGAALYNSGSNPGGPAMVELQYATVEGNESELDGGAIHNEAQLSLLDSTFTGNVVTGRPPFGGGGGAVYNTSLAGQMRAIRTRFAGNSAFRGGALSSYNASAITLDQCDVEENFLTDLGDGGGGIWSENNTTLVVRNSRITRNQAIGFCLCRGGGIQAGDTLNSALILESSEVADNVAGGDGGGVYIHSSNTGVASAIVASSIHDNEAMGGDGGGIYKGGISPLDIVASVILDNVAWGEGGGLHFDNPTATATSHSIVGSTISGNLSHDTGGGLSSVALATTILVDRTTISGNRVETTGATGEGGAGIRNELGVVEVRNATIHGNVVVNADGDPSGSGAAVHNGNGGLVRLVHATVTGNSAYRSGGLRAAAQIEVTDSIVAENQSVVVDALTGPNCVLPATITDHGGTLTDDGTSCPLTFVVSGSLDLGPLADYGGPTQTRALGSASTAIDAGSACSLPTDQRGVLREATCDAGAWEGDVVLPALTFQVPTSTVGEDPGGLHQVGVSLDNTGGTLTDGSVLAYVTLGGTAAGGGADYAVTTVVPISFAGAAWPAPGTIVTQTVELDVIPDRLVEGSEIVVIGLRDAGIVGPADLGSIADHTVTILDAVSDLVVTKTVGLEVDGGHPGVADTGDVVTYTVRVTNAGPTDATDVTIEDALDGLDLDVGTAVVTASTGTYDLATGEWSADGAGAGHGFPLAAGETATLTITAVLRPASEGRAVANTAALSAAFPPGAADPEPANDAAQATFGVCGASAPTIAVAVEPAILWPPTRRLVPVIATVTVGGAFDPTAKLISVTSSEPTGPRGSGQDAADIVVHDDVTFDLRADRSGRDAGRGPGRVYTLTWEATDLCGAAARATAMVVVPSSPPGPGPGLGGRRAAPEASTSGEIPPRDNAPSSGRRPSVERRRGVRGGR